MRAHGRPDAFYWKGPDGAKVLVYYQEGFGCWAPQSYDQVLKELPGMLNGMDAKGNPFSVMRYAGYGCIDNQKTDIAVSHVVEEWNRKWAYPKLIVSTNTMFFDKLAKQCSDVRTFSGDLPDTDYPVGAASSAKETSINRETQNKLSSAEVLATLSHLLLKSNYPDKDIRKAYEQMMLYDEHTWGGSYNIGHIQDWAWSEKSNYAYKASGLTDVLLSKNANDIAAAIAFTKDVPHIVVFNTLSFGRTDLVNIPLRAKYFGDPVFPLQEPFELIDTETGKVVPHQLIKLEGPTSPVPYAAERYGKGQYFNAEGMNLAFIADHVPAIGYKSYRVIPLKKNASVEESKFKLTNKSIENQFYKVTLNEETGTVESIYDKELGVELVDKAAPHQINQLITRLVKTGKQESPKTATIHSGLKGPLMASLVVSTSAVGCPEVTQEILLYNNIKRIDFSNRVLKDSKAGMEIYFAFPFNIDNPDFRFEAPNSVIKPLRDQFPGSNSNYYSTQHWADVSNGKVGITFTSVDNHLMEFGGLWPTQVSQAHHGVPPPDFGAEFVTEINKGYIYSYPINSNFRTNFQASQLCDILLRYSITTHQGDWVKGHPKDFGWALSNPFIPVTINKPDKGTLPEFTGLIKIDQQNILLTAMKKAEDGNGIIIRLIETEGRDTEFNLTLPSLNIQSVYETDLVEINQNILNTNEHLIKTNIKAFGIRTLRIINK